MEPARCPDCGAPQAGSTCAELFDRLLALDHSRRQPWGDLHGQAVACYFVQHPSAPRAPRDGATLRAFLRRSVATADRPVDGPVTIHDAALDGTFPADGYAQRLDRWARWIVAAPSDD